MFFLVYIWLQLLIYRLNFLYEFFEILFVLLPHSIPGCNELNIFKIVFPDWVDDLQQVDWPYEFSCNKYLLVPIGEWYKIDFLFVNSDNFYKLPYPRAKIFGATCLHGLLYIRSLVAVFFHCVEQ